MADAPWSELPGPTIAAVREALGPIVDDIIDAIRAESRVYDEVLGAPEGIGIRFGIEQAIGTFLDAIETGERPGGETGEVWRRLGEAEFQAGRALDPLRQAFRSGTRAAWRGAAQVAARAGLQAPVVIALAEAIFLYSDELAADVVEGYIRAQSDEAGERERRRRRLALLLLDVDGDPEAIAHAASLARWPLPRGVAVLAHAGEIPREIARRLDPDVLVGTDVAVLPDPDAPGRAAALARAFAGTRSAIGPSVEPAGAHRSLQWARIALGLIGGALTGPTPVAVSEHLATVILLQDEELARTLVARALAPLRELPDADRERLLETLAAWFAHQRHTPGVAAELHVHPQTVRYRIGKLRELLGEALDTAEGRFELELALRARAALDL
jgi:hypothetical protein